MNITTERHRLYVCQQQGEERIKELENIGDVGDHEYVLSEGEVVDKEEIEVTAISCECGESFENQEEGKKHLMDVESVKRGKVHTENVKEALDGTKMYGFECVGTTTVDHIVWYHTELALALYATPNFSNNGQIDIQLSPTGSRDMAISEIEGQVVDSIKTTDTVLTAEDYLKELRFWIEENLLVRKNE